MAMRVTMHSGRIRRNGTAFNPNHNDRNFDVDHAENIKNDKVKDNIYWAWNQNDKDFYSESERKNFESFADSEMQFYELKYRKLYEDQQAKHRAARHYKQLKNFEDWKKTRRYCPEESYMQIGKMEEHPDKEKFHDATMLFLKKMSKWGRENGDHMHILNIALHFDEEVPQVHIRRIWDYTDENGQLRIGQEKALEQSGVELPEPSKPMSRYNHRKKTFDALMRLYWQESCKEVGLDIITEALPEAKYGRTKEQFLRDKFEQVTKENDALIEENQRLKELLEKAKTQQEQATQTIEHLDTVFSAKMKSLEDRSNELVDKAYMLINDMPEQVFYEVDNALRNEPRKFTDKNGEQYVGWKSKTYNKIMALLDKGNDWLKNTFNLKKEVGKFLDDVLSFDDELSLEDKLARATEKSASSEKKVTTIQKSIETEK